MNLRGEDIMSQIDDFYDKMYVRERERKDEKYNQIIKEFESLSLEEKVDRLIEIYARERAYR